MNSVGKGHSLIKSLRSSEGLKLFKLSNLISTRSAALALALAMLMTILSMESAIIGAQISVGFFLIPPPLSIFKPEADETSYQIETEDN